MTNWYEMMKSWGWKTRWKNGRKGKEFTASFGISAEDIEDNLGEEVECTRLNG